MSSAPGPELTGRLLVAAPMLTDPHFARAVVLLLDHDADGTLGVIVNRPSELDVGEVLPAWRPVVTGPPVVFQGGPVALDAALGLAAVAASGEGLLGWREVGPGFGLLDLDAPPELLGPGLRSLRIFAGYAGWAPGQLEAEVAQGAWYVVESAPGDPFSAEPEALWRAVLRRQRGALAFAATYPEDPSMN